MYGALEVTHLLLVLTDYNSHIYLPDYLAASHHGRGIMSAALGTLIRYWGIPRMNARIIRAETFSGNEGSKRVFEKNGFVFEKEVDYPMVMQSGETRLGFYVLWWRLAEQPL